MLLPTSDANNQQNKQVRNGNNSLFQYLTWNSICNLSLFFGNHSIFCQVYKFLCVKESLMSFILLFGIPFSSEEKAAPCTTWLHRVQLFVTPMDYSLPGSSVHRVIQPRMGHLLSGSPFPTPGGLLDPGIKPTSLTAPALAGRLFITSTTLKARVPHDPLPAPSNCTKRILPTPTGPIRLSLSGIRN